MPYLLNESKDAHLRHLIEGDGYPFKLGALWKAKLIVLFQNLNKLLNI